MSAELSSLVSRLEAVTSRLENVASKGGAGDAAPSSEAVSDYGDYIAQYIDPFVAATSKVASEKVQQAAGLVKLLAEEQKKFLTVVSEHAAPSQAVLSKMLEPMSNIIGQIGQIKDKMFKDRDFANYTAALNESITAFGWVQVSPAPAPYVKECGNGAEFYTNRILKEKQDKDWVKALKSIFPPLFDYVKKHHTTGLNWKKDGPIATAGASPAAPPPPSAPAPPPPPAPGAAPASTGGGAADVSALLSDLNKGSCVTQGLKKVTDDMKTHKNPALRLQSAVPYKAPAAKAKPVSKPAAAGPVKTPKLELVGKKWIVEYQSGKSDLLIENAEMKHTVYVFKCDNCTLQIQGKVNQIILDGCKKTGVVFDTVVSSVEFVNCQSVKAQVTGLLPTASIEKTDGCQLYLSKESVNCQVISAKSSEMNICIMKDDGDYAEYPIVEQFRTTWDGKQFVTEPTENAE